MRIAFMEGQEPRQGVTGNRVSAGGWGVIRTGRLEENVQRR